LRKLRKLMRATPPTKIDLVQYLKLRGHAQTTGEAKLLIESGRVFSESHPLTDRLVSATLRPTINVKEV
jgi:hypothetical protein